MRSLSLQRQEAIPSLSAMPISPSVIPAPFRHSRPPSVIPAPFRHSRSPSVIPAPPPSFPPPAIIPAPLRHSRSPSVIPAPLPSFPPPAVIPAPRRHSHSPPFCHSRKSLAGIQRTKQEAGNLIFLACPWVPDPIISWWRETTLDSRLTLAGMTFLQKFLEGSAV